MLVNIQDRFLSSTLSDSILSNRDLIGDVIFVDQNPAKLEILRKIKDGDSILSLKEIQTHSLESKNFTCKNSNESDLKSQIINHLDQSFISHLDSNSTVNYLQYYRKGFSKIFKSPYIERLTTRLSHFDWAIASDSCVKEIERAITIHYAEDDKMSQIELYGKAKDNQYIFRTNLIDNNTIYIGLRSKTSCIFLDELNIEKKTNIYDIGMNFKFNTQEIIKLVLK